MPNDALVPEVLPGSHSPLPGEREVEDALLARAAAEVNRLHAEGNLQTQRRIAQYVLDTFFNGDIEAFRSRSKKHVTYRALCERKLLPFSSSHVWYCVQIDRQLRELPQEIGEALPVSHHRLLSHVQDPDVKRELAEVAVKEGLSREALMARIEARKRPQAEGQRRGRPASPGFAKVLSKLRAASTLAREQKFESGAFDLDEARKAIEEAERELDAISEYIDLLKDALGAAER